MEAQTGIGWTGRSPAANRWIPPRITPADGREAMPWTAAGFGLSFLAGIGLAWWAAPRAGVTLLQRWDERTGAERSERLAVSAATVTDGVRSLAIDEPYGSQPLNTLDVFAPADAGPKPMVIWAHGGGFISGSKNEIRPFLKVLAGRGFTVVGVDYSLAPDARYPTPVVEFSAALRHVLEQAERFEVDPNRIVLAGDSAGAHIAGQLGFSIVDASYAAAAGLPRPLRPDALRALILPGGVFDLALGREVSGVGGWVVRTILRAYSGVREPVTDPRFHTASLVEHVPAGTPPVYLTAGNDDLLRPHTVRFASALLRAGIEVVDDTVGMEQLPRLLHDYQMDLGHQRSWTALDRIAALIDRTTAVPDRDRSANPVSRPIATPRPDASW